MNSDFDLRAFRGKMCSLGAGDMPGDGGGDEPTGIIAGSKYDVQLINTDTRYPEAHRAYTPQNPSVIPLVPVERDINAEGPTRGAKVYPQSRSLAHWE